ncbi:hypothetical protein [Candidatus Berkiella aquae]|uniref:Acyl transferase n=1 Tax=Candidatus Berkiella aquae TaxID=295108 RepID=A0A0Q9YMK3_9GAMM|nr:hypothetical protein [Candidatus Berkiella aquae]MCS5710316.1 hypothetical protein [Candidatus Berkiella aquae]
MGLILKKAMTLFGFLHIVTIVFSGWQFILSPSMIWFAGLLFSIYFLPIIVFRLQDIFVPLQEGKFDFDEHPYCPWWGAHQIQQLYAAVPFLEGLLRIIPGAYSFWLRLWGSKIGKQVYWTPRIEIVDRSLLEIGDYVIFGHRAACSSHIISQKNNKLRLQIGKVRLGKRVLVGAGVRLGPGTIIADNISIPVCSTLLIDQHIESQDQLKAVHHDPIPRPISSDAL